MASDGAARHDHRSHAVVTTTRRRFRAVPLAASLLMVSLFVVGACSTGPAADPIPSDCPTTATAPDPITHAGGLLVEPDGVQAAMVCRYDGSSHLRQSANVTDASRLAALTSEINDGEPLPKGPISCPVMDGSSYTIYLTRGGGSGDAIVVQPSGCRSVQHGRQGHWATDPLLQHLSSIAGAREVP